MAKILADSDPRALADAASTILAGGLVVFPTDTVYGLGCSAVEISSIERLFAVKGRDSSKAIAILVADLPQFNQAAASIPAAAQLLALEFLPGPLTLVLPRHSQIPDILSPLPTIGIRIPNHAFAQNLLRKTGPLAVTSANLSGQPSSLTAQDASSQLGGAVDLIIDGGTAPGGIPSTVVDCTVNPPVVLRVGPIPESEIHRVLQSV